ncbi:RagB/SusD family nutrient uptake outer membrane protein [Pedobacter sp.]|uniref:RagB/SusD family nutrient uptake outer membrane protein n=1 Tax=Pedobacter sp. TaxID=1411316 RepID=UPI003D7F223D
MKNYITNKGGFALMLFLLVCTSCTKLDEDLYGRLTPENFYKNDAEVLSALAGVYNRMGFTVNGGNGWRIANLGTDEFLIPSRADGRWFDGGVYLEFSKHAWTPSNNRISSGWTEIFGAIGAANAIMESLESSPQKDNLKAQIAEARGIRAYAYFYALDLWGNVPIVTTARIDPNNLPANKTRTEVFDFVVSEFQAVAADLPSVLTVNRVGYYPRMTKEAVYSLLAITYLNAQVYTGTAKWAECIEMCNNVMSGNAYKLTADYFENFIPKNEGSPEFIYAISMDPSRQAGGNTFAQRVLHDSHRFTYTLPFTPQNGFTTLEEAVNRYEEQDLRKTMILRGPQFDAQGNPLKTISGSANLVLIPHVNQENSAENEGFRVLKWRPDVTWVNGAASNDIATIRYAEILLTKAEALLRSGGNAGEALTLVNQVRQRSNATVLQSLTLKNIEDERARELIYESSRRRDMIRFGTWFTGTWKFKTTVTPETRKILPIPVTELNANSALKQNPGY